MIRVASSRFGLEYQVPGYVLTEPLTAIFDADLLAVILDDAVAGAESLGAILTLPDHRPAATAQPPAMIAARRLAILADFHAMRPSTLAFEAFGATTHARLRLAPICVRSQHCSTGKERPVRTTGWRWPVEVNRLERAGRGLQAELAVRRLSAALPAFLDCLLTLELEDRNDVVLVDVPAREATGVHAVRVRFDQHQS